MPADFDDPRLAAIYDTFDGPRDDLDAYVAIVAELGARSVIDVGCGTGDLAIRLATLGLDVVGVDPSTAMLGVARAKPGAHLATWIDGDATALRGRTADVAVMTGNVAQVFVTDDAWTATLRSIGDALTPDGHVVFESRVPERRAWSEWTPDRTRRRASVPGGGTVEVWCDVTSVDGDLVSFGWTHRFDPDDVSGTVATSESTLRFRSLDELTSSLDGCGFDVTDVRDAPDRPGQELVVLARRR